MLPPNFCERVLIVSALFLLVNGHAEDCGLSYSITSEEGESVNAAEGSWPWMVALIVTKETKKREHQCSGFLFDDIHILSAAHCFDNTEDDQITALIGSVNEDEAEEYFIESIDKHPGYIKGRYYDDLAILKLTVRVGYRKWNPICLPDQVHSASGILWSDEMVQQIPKAGSKATEIGWDKVSRRSNNILMQVSGIETISDSECTSKFSRITNFNSTFPSGIKSGILCGIVPGKTYSCVTESGSPLMSMIWDRWFAVGVSSFGILCGNSDFPEGFTRISPYLPWIRNNTRERN